MNEEEKRAIENKKFVILIDKQTYGEDNENFKTDEILLDLIDKLQKKLEIKDKVIDLMYQDIESEYLGTSYMEYYSLENYYRKAEEND